MAEKREKPAPKSRSRDGGDKRERILRAAIKVFAKHGFYATRVSEIAKEAGVADGTIYLYFKNKDDVLISIFEDRIRKLIELLERLTSEANTTEARLRSIIEVQLGLFEGERELAEVVTVNLRQSSKLLKQYATPLFNQYLGLIARVIAEGQAEGTVRDDLNPRILARAMWGGLDGIALYWTLSGGGPEKLRESAKQYAEFYWSGIVARKDESTA